MAMYEVGTVTGAASQARVTGATTKWSQVALGYCPGRFWWSTAAVVLTCMRSNPWTATRN